MTEGQLRVCRCIAVSIYCSPRGIKDTVKTSVIVTVKINACVIGLEADGIKDLKRKVYILCKQFESCLDTGTLLKGFIPVVEELVNRLSLSPRTKVNTCLDLNTGKCPDIYISATLNCDQVVNAIKAGKVDTRCQAFKCGKVKVDWEVL